MAKMKKKQHKKKPIIGAAASEMLTLEPRIMLDAAALATGAEVVAEADLSVVDSSGLQLPETMRPDEGPKDVAKFDSHEEKSSDEAITSNEPAAVQDKTDYEGVELVFVDKSIGDYQTLLSGIAENSKDVHGNERLIEVIEIEPDADGILTITTTLAEYSDVDAIHILSHADSAVMNIGSTALNSDNIADYADQFAQWQNVLSENADILIYGCNVADGEAGIEFVNELAELTLTDVAASVNLTGHANLGADFNLEYSTGNIEAQNPLSDYAMANWNGVLTAELVLVKVISDGLVGGEVIPGTEVEFTITLENIGDMDATNVVLLDFLSENLIFDNFTIDYDFAPVVYEAVGNTQLEVSDVRTISPAVHNTMLLSEMPGFISGTSGVTAFAGATTLGGFVEVFADGSFIYTPPTGTTSTTDSFTYELTDLLGDASEFVSVEIVINDRVWYADAGAVVNGDGSSASPFNIVDATTINDPTGAADIDLATDYLFLFDDPINPLDYNLSFIVEDGQSLTGEGAQLVVNGHELTDTISRPNMTSLSFLASGEARGLTIGQNIIGATPGSSITISDIDVNTASNGSVVFQGVLLDVTLDNLVSVNSAVLPLFLNNLVAGSEFTVDGSTTITNLIAQGIQVDESPNSAFDFGDVTIGHVDTTVTRALTFINNVGSTFNFDSMNVSTASPNGALILDSGTFNFVTPASYTLDDPAPGTQVANTALTITNTDGFVFGNFNVTSLIQALNTGIALDGVDGFTILNGNFLFSVAFGGAVVDIANSTNVLINNMTLQGIQTGDDSSPVIHVRDSSDLTFSNLTINGSSTSSFNTVADVVLENVSGVVEFDNVDIFHASSGAAADVLTFSQAAGTTLEFIFKDGSIWNFPGANQSGIKNLSSPGDETLFFDIRNNDFDNASVEFNIAGNTAHLEGAIQSNTFDENVWQGGSIFINGSGTSRMIVAIQDNTINNQFGGGNGIEVSAAGNTLDLRVSSNAVDAGTFFGNGGLEITDLGGSIIRALIEGNTNIEGSDGIVLTGSAAAGSSIVALISNNDINENLGLDLVSNDLNVAVELGFNLSSGDGLFTSSAPITFGTLVGFVETTYPADFVPTPLLALHGERMGEQMPGITQDALDGLVDVAIANWMSTGLSYLQIATLDNITFNIENLDYGILGLHQGNEITIDENAANYGWYIDGTPLDAIEFSNPMGPHASQYDLLTVLMHEIGHVLKVPDMAYDSNNPHLMADKLDVGTRLLPDGYVATLTYNDLANIFDAAIQHWIEAGISDEQIALLNTVTYEIIDLQGYLGKQEGTHIQIDDDAGAYDWFIDSSPLDHSEFSEINPDYYYSDNGRMDLLTVVMHELGHVLNIPDAGVNENLMTEGLLLGARYLPSGLGDVTAYVDAEPIVSANIDPPDLVLNWDFLRPGDSMEIVVTADLPIFEPVDLFEVTNAVIVTYSDGVNPAPVIVQDEVSAPVSLLDPVLLDVMKEVNPATLTGGFALPGTNVEFFITIENVGLITATNVDVDDSLNGVVTDLTVIASLDPGDSVVIPFVTLVPDPVPFGVTDLNNFATLAFFDGFNDQSIDSNTVVVPIETNTVVSIEKVPSAPVVMPSDLLIYTITIDNIGNADVDNVIVTETLPDNTTFDFGNSTFGWIDNLDGTFSFDVGLLPAIDGPLDLEFAVIVDSVVPVDAEVLSNEAEVEFFDGVSTEMSITPVVNVDVDADPIMIIDKVPDITTVLPGGTVIYTITLDNIGNQDAGNVVIDETIPDIATFDLGNSTPGWVNNFDGTFSFNVGDVLVVDPVLSIDFAVTIPNTVPVDVESVSNKATVTYFDGEATQMEMTGVVDVAVDAEPIITVDKVPSLLVVEPGVTDTLIYTITINNIGNQDANAVIVTENLPGSTLFDPLNSTGGLLGWVDEGGGIFSFDVGDLFAQVGPTILEFAVTIPDVVPVDVEELSNKATVSYFDGVLPDQMEMSGTVIVDVDAEPIILIDKIANLDPVVPGDTLIYTISVDNIGNQDANAATILESIFDFTVFDPGNSTVGWVDNFDGTFGFEIADIFVVDPVLFVDFAITLPNIIPAHVETLTNEVDITFFNGVMDETVVGTPVVVDVDADPDLVITKVDEPDVVVAGDSIIYTITLDNTGNQDTDGVFLVETLPLGTTFDPANSTVGWVNNFDGTFSFDLGLVMVVDGVITVDFAVIPDVPGENLIEIFNQVNVEDDDLSGLDANFFDNQAVEPTLVFVSDPFASSGPELYERLWQSYFEAGRGVGPFPFDFMPQFGQLISLDTMDERVNLVGSQVIEYYDPFFGPRDFAHDHLQTIRYGTSPAIHQHYISETGQQFPGWTPHAEMFPESQFILRHVDHIAESIQDAINEAKAQAEAEPEKPEETKGAENAGPQAINENNYKTFDKQIHAMSSQFDRDRAIFAAAAKRFEE